MDGAVLVTGAAGFIGSHVCEVLVARGYDVVGVDNFDPVYDIGIKRANLVAIMRSPRFRLAEIDVRSQPAVAELLSTRQYAGVIHLAARAGVRPSLSDPLLYEDVNVRGTTVLLDAARLYPETHVVIASSSSVYGATSQVPFREDEAADRPSSPYAATKRAAEILAYCFHEIYGSPVTVLRFFTVYGPRQRPEMAIHAFTRRIVRGEPVDLFGEGSASRDYTYVDDIVDGVVRALERPCGYRVFNLGTTATTRLIDLVEMIAERVGRRPRVHFLPAQPGDVPITYADITRARDILGYSPATSIAQGLDRFVEWYCALAESVDALVGA